MSEIYKRYEAEFRRMFNVPLSQYWDSRVGLLLLPFMTQVLDYQGKHPNLSCSQRFGKEGTALIGSILEDTAKLW